ncbi:MAG: YncE family protein [Mucinivorans sp.]
MKLFFTKASFRAVYGMVPAVTLLLLSTIVLSCSKNTATDQPPILGDVYVLCEGTYMASNGSLTLYNSKTGESRPNFFKNANSIPLGDSPTSLTLYDGRGWLAISGSGKVFVIDPLSGVLTDKITGLNSPRYIHIVHKEKGYITNVMSSEINIFNPTTLQLTSSITLPDGLTGEMMVCSGEYIYVNCWSYGKRIVKIDTRTDKIVASTEVGVQPMCLYMDASGSLWTMTDGGYAGNPTGYENPRIVRLDPTTMNITLSLEVPRGTALMHKMVMSGDRRTMYYMSGDIYRLDYKAIKLPTEPFIRAESHSFYSMGVHPIDGDLYLADAIDFKQNGVVYRYSASSGVLLSSFSVGIAPGGFAFLL